MAVEVIESDKGDVFICNTTDVAFGPVMECYTGEDFLAWLTDQGIDPRDMSTDELRPIYDLWKEREESSND